MARPPRDCDAPIRTALAENGADPNALSDEQIANLLARLADRQKRRMNEEPHLEGEEAWAAAAQDMTLEEIRAQLIQERQAAFSKRSFTAATATIDRMEGPRHQAVLAFVEGDETLGFARGESTDALMQGEVAARLGVLNKGLEDAGVFGRMTGLFRRRDVEWEKNINRELWRQSGDEREKPTGDTEAENAAAAFIAAREPVREYQNGNGSWIAQRKGYGFKQSWDRLKVEGGFWKGLVADPTTGDVAGVLTFRQGAWAALKKKAADKAQASYVTTMRRLLSDETFEGLPELEDMGALPTDFPGTPAATKEERFLQQVWWGKTNGRHEELGGWMDEFDYRPPGASLARKVSEGRVLIFKNADAAWEANELFGQGSMYQIWHSQIERGARNAILMKRLTPNPEHGLERLIAHYDIGYQDAVRIRQAYDQVSGRANAPTSVRLAQVGRNLRALQSMAKLGGMLLSAMPDTAIASQTLARTGLSFLEGYDGIIRNMASHERSAEVGDLVDVGARSAAGGLASRLWAADGPTGWSAWGMRLQHRMGGFEFWNNRLRASVSEILANRYGNQAAHAWDGLHVGSRETLERYGFDAGSWDLWRKHAKMLDDDGRMYLTFDGFKDMAAMDREALLDWHGAKGAARTDVRAAQAADDIRLRAQAMFHDLIDTAVSEARARERRITTFGTKPGTPEGEAIRSITQFWAFPQAFIMRQLAPARAGYAGMKPWQTLAHLIVATTAFGYLSVQAKQISKGREPRPLLNEDGSLNLEVWGAAALQGGGLGIYGDFLFGEYNRMGGGVLGTVAGPLVGEADRAVNLFMRLKSGDESVRKGIPSEAFRFAVGNTPFINTWYTRWALDAAVLWRLQEAISPGSARRYEKSVKEKTGADFIVRPSELVR